MLVGFDSVGVLDVERLLASAEFPRDLARYLSDSWSTVAREAVSGASANYVATATFDTTTSAERGGEIARIPPVDIEPLFPRPA